jgi:hypothetical protein
LVKAAARSSRSQHDPEKWASVSRLREAMPAANVVVFRFGGRSQVG